MSWFTLLVVAFSLHNSACSKKISFDEVVPFLQVRNTTNIKNTLALKFKPQLYISSGCHPYPAVDANGNTNAGIEKYHFFTDCDGSPKGSQVYGRAAEVDGKWGFMFSWYFPRDSTASKTYYSHRHAWSYVVLWLSSLSDDAKLLSVTIKSSSDYSKHTPETDEMDGNHIKLRYKSWLRSTYHYLELTDKDGKYQDLIMWDDMTDAARKALDHTEFYDSKAPFSDANFEDNIDEAYPFDKDDEDGLVL